MRRWLILLAIGYGTLHAETVLALPFFNHADSANLDWIGESIAETLRDAMTPEGVLVLDRGDRLEAYRRLSLRPGAELTLASIVKIGESLDASLSIYGAYEVPSKGTLRITARILDLTADHPEPRVQRNGRAGRPGHPGVPSGLAGAAANALEISAVRGRVFAGAPSGAAGRRGKLRPRAPGGSPDQQHLFFTRAARLDPNYSQPCFQLGKIFWEKKDYKIAAGWLERVTSSDPHYLEAQFFLGLCRYNMADFNGAEQCFRTVAESVPLNEVYDDLGAAESRLNQSEAALANFRKALEGDGGDPDYHFNVGYTLWRAKQFDAAAESFRAAVERNPEDTEADALLGRALKKEGPRPGDPKSEARERLKTDYEEAAFRQLQAALGK